LGDRADDEGEGMIARVVSPDALSEAEVAQWSALHRDLPSLASPYFSPAFASVIASVRSDVRVAVLEADGQTFGFFPFQRGTLGAGWPVGAMLSDYHGVIAEPDAAYDARALIRASGLKTWEFNHLVAAQTAFEPFQHSLWDSQQIDLRSGYERYLAGVESAHGPWLRELRRKARKLEREGGELTFQHHTDDSAALETLFRWKSDQFTRTGTVDLLKHDWIRDVLRKVHATQGAGFQGVLSLLLAGEQPVAAHLGLRSAGALHYWFPAYDPDFARCSPGLVLLLRLAESAALAGVDTFDLGTGDYDYKRRLSNRVAVVARGAVETPSLRAAAVRVRRTAKSLIRQTGVAPRIRVLARVLRSR
jgi:CelD/BcsL family acetyltransferase involved in cellulose biosynthesis